MIAVVQRLLSLSPRESRQLQVRFEMILISDIILIIAAWLRDQADYLERKTFTRDMVIKITGSNHSDEKARVMELFGGPHK